MARREALSGTPCGKDRAKASATGDADGSESIGAEFAAVLWLESLYRSFANRKQVAAYAGLARTPWQSGSVAHEQGVFKAGNPLLRTTMIQLSWLWLQHQPHSPGRNGLFGLRHQGKQYRRDYP
jgi:transposase